jgi:hypothetical protein
MNPDEAIYGTQLAAPAVLATLAVIILGACSEKLMRVTVCDLTVRPGAYQGKHVQMAGSVLSDGIERTVVSNDTCPDHGVTPEFPDTPNPDPGVVALQDAIFTGRPGAFNKSITAVFTGTFEWLVCPPIF